MDLSVMINDEVMCQVWKRVESEMGRAELQHPHYPKNELRRAALVVEEAGEVMKAALDYTRDWARCPPATETLEQREAAIETHLTPLRKHLMDELDQTAAAAIKMLYVMTVEAAARKRDRILS